MINQRRIGILPVSIVMVTVALSGVSSASRVVERRTVGRSVEKAPLRVLNIGARDRPTKVLVVGCIHGNECAGKAILRELRQMDSPKGFELWLMWNLNPDGAAVATRQNARGVDLNRNFASGWRGGGEAWDTYYPGPYPLSEPETRAAVRLIEDLKPDITIWYHQHMSLVTKMKRHRAIQRRYARIVGLPLERLDPLPGTATRWQNHQWPGRTAFVVELPAGSLSESPAITHARAVRSVSLAWKRRS